MKSPALLVGLLAAVAMLGGCDNIFGLDNYDPPQSTLTGRLAYQGEAIGVRSGGVELELWQPGYELNEKIPVYVAQDGTFTAKLFDGSYKLNLRSGNGAWVDNPDTIRFELKGSTDITVPVTPYYTIENESITHDAGVNAPVGAIRATFDIGQVTPARPVEFVGLYVATTSFVDRNHMVVRTEKPMSDLDLSAPITLSVDLPANIHTTPSPESRDSVSVRVGVKTSGVDEMLFTKVYKVGI
jgi:hypothetical protein